ncbi:hypothetical protein E2562_036742 [Oryza meyeriana var. granulata]|uniref:Uncharacterized protein n=1 Tax=Oryza meyeriana var. granulata TaxID=110450 RepID=A0A6G1DT10_9ORYZ|nr:hypothetical protein E2562_036742 [Oryza meyeriana var. granulata]
MVAGYDEGIGASIYCVGPSSPLRRVENGALGCGSSLCAAVMDRHYRAGMTVREAVAVVDKCIRELRRLGSVSFMIKIVDKDGAREYARRTLSHRDRGTSHGSASPERSSGSRDGDGARSSPTLQQHSSSPALQLEHFKGAGRPARSPAVSGCNGIWIVREAQAI